LEFIPGKMAGGMKGTTLMIRNMGKGLMFGRMERSTMATGITANNME
jgi:hypothetical protein